MEPSNLSTLRQKIEERKKGKWIDSEINEEKLKVTRSLLEIPEITTEPGETKSDERYEQLTKKVEALFHNYTVSEEKFIQANDDMRNAYKELARCFEELLLEGIKTRF